MKRYAADTTVPVARSRGEIDSLLRQWKCKGIQWTDQFDDGIVVLRFAWAFEGNSYMTRFTIRLPSESELMKQAIDGRSSTKISPIKLEKLQAKQGQQEHRILLLWLKAAFNAVQAGIVRAEEIFLPFLEGANGQTVSEAVLPRLALLMTDNPSRLLTQGA